MREERAYAALTEGAPARAPLREEGIAPGISEQAVIDALSTVYDPEIPVNVYDLGLIYVIDIDDRGRIRIEMTLTSPGCPSAQEIPVAVHDVLMAVEGVRDVDVRLVWNPPWDMSRMSEDARLQLDM